MNTQEFITRANEVHNNRYLYDNCEYTTSRKKLIITCRKHGDFEQRASAHLAGQTCTQCTNRKSITLSMFIETSNKIHNNIYDYSLISESDVLTNKSYVNIKCPKHGSFKQRISSHMAGYGCSKCSSNIRRKKKYNKITNEQKLNRFIVRSNDEHNNFYSYEDSIYVDAKIKLDIICPIHGKFSQTPNNHMRGNGCPKCSRLSSIANLTKSFDKFVSDSYALYGSTRFIYTPESYKNSKTKVDIFCIEHNISFKQTPDCHLSGRVGCNKCFINNKEEEILNNFITSLGIETIQNSKKIIPPKELDIYIPSHNLAIEYCGNYWHSEKFGKYRHYHHSKYEECKKKGIQLITIFEDEWKERNEQVKNKLKSLLNKDDRPVIYARKCEIMEVPKKDKTIFLDDNHIQGDGSSSINYGLYYDGDLVACMIFTNNKNGNFVLNRYATSHRVVGGFSKLLKYFKNNNLWNKLTSFADNRWSDGNLYEQTGWILDNTLAPDYFYYYDRTRMHKFNFRRKKLEILLGEEFDPTETEYENCLRNEIYRIWDCGKQRFIMENNK